MKSVFQLLLWINLALASLCAAVLARDLLRADLASSGRSLFASGIWMAFALFCYHQIKRLERQAGEMLVELKKLGFEQALKKARENSVSLPRSLVAPKVAIQGKDWQAFERNSVQFVIARSDDSNRARVEIIR